jgi:peptidoglycan/LPS O-acetylase OafA/YrhL
VVNVLFFSLIALPRVVGRTGLLAVFLVSLVVVSKNGLISNATALGGIDNDIFRTIVGFLAGAAASVFDAKMLSRVEINKYFGDFAAIVCIAVFIFYCVNGDFNEHWDLEIALACFPLLIFGVIHGYVVRSILRVRPLVYLGTISYSIYLVHYPLQLAIHIMSVVTGIKMLYGNAFFLIAYMLLTIALASFTYWAIESPGKRLIKGEMILRRANRVVSD